MGSCSGITGTGERCRAIAITGSNYCHAHHPDRAEVRRRAARKGGQRGGRGRPQAELSELRAQLSDLYSSVLTDMIDPKVGAVLAQITNAQIRLTEVELKAHEQLVLEQRMEEIEEHIAQSKGSLSGRTSPSWG